MALIGNYSVLNKSPARKFAGASESELRSNFNTPGSSRAMYMGEARISKLSAIPRGYAPGDAWVFAFRGGDMASVNEATATITENALVVSAGRNIQGATTLTLQEGTVSLQLVVSGSGTATLTLSGSGALAGALAGSGTASFVFDGNSSLAGALASVVGSSTLSLSGTALIRAIGSLEGHLLPYTENSPENIARLVWEAILESGYSAGDLMRIIASVQAGSATGLSASPSFTGLDGATVRVAGTVSGDTRTITTIDGAL